MCVLVSKLLFVPDVPYEAKKLGVELQNGKTIKEIQELEIHEIDCDNLQI